MTVCPSSVSKFSLDFDLCESGSKSCKLLRYFDMCIFCGFSSLPRSLAKPGVNNFDDYYYERERKFCIFARSRTSYGSTTLVFFF